MQMKRARSFKKAATLIMTSSFCFFFLHLPMAWFKVYSLVYPEQSASALNSSGVSQLLLATNAARAQNPSDTDKATLDMIEIGKRFAFYPYYLAFVSNVFFLSFGRPRRIKTNSNSSNLKLNILTANKSKSNRKII
jgi:hypothetical protein